MSLALILCASALPQQARAGGFTISIIGGRRTAMGTNLARPDDVTALMHNPAGLADLPGRRVHLSTSATFLKTRFDLQALDPKLFPEINPAHCEDDGPGACPWPIGEDGYYTREITPEKYFGVLPFAGFSSDLAPFSKSLKDVVVGLAIYAPDFYGAFLPEDAPTAYHITEGTFLVLATTAGVGYRINKHISLGASLSLHYMRLSYAQKFSLTDLLTPDGEEPGMEGVFGQSMFGDLRLDYAGVDLGLGWNLSLLIDPLPWLSFGLSYNGATTAEFEGDIGLTSTRNADQLESSFNSLGYKVPRQLVVEMGIPHSLQFGLNVHPTSWLELGMDYRLWLYNLFSEQAITPVYDPGQEELTEPLTREALSRDKMYDVSYEIALGALVRPLARRPELELMLGLMYDQSPIPDETFTLDNPSLSQLGGSLGARMVLYDHWRVALSYILLFYLERDVRTSETSPPTNVRGSGVAHIPGVEVEYLF